MFKYVNPGYLSLFDSSTIKGIESTSKEHNPQNQISFNTLGGYCYIVPDEKMKECWIKFDLHYVKTTNGQYCFTLIADEKILCIREKKGTFTVEVDAVQLLSFNMTINAISSIEIHVRSDTVNGIMEIYVNNIKQSEYAGNVLNGEEVQKIGFINGFGSATGNFMSNIIAQNTGRIGSEQIAILPILSTETDWQDNGDGSYTATANEQEVIQNIDVEKFKLDVGANEDLQVYSISIAAINAYSENDTLNELTAIIKSGSQVKKIESKQIGTSASGGMYTKALDKNPFITDAWSIDALSALKFGLQAKPYSFLNGIHLNGVDAYIKLPQELLTGRSTYTIELTFSTTQKVAGSEDWNSPCICGMLNAGGNVVYITNNAGYVSLGVPNGNVGREMLADGKVHHIAIISDSTKIKGYCEKIQYEQTRDSKIMDNISINFGVGLPQCRAYAECIIYEARFWEIAKDPATLGEKIIGNETGLRAWYQCQETGGNILKDSSINGYNGTIFGNVWG